MNKLVYTVFKTIALSIIFIFLFDILFYMYKVTSLNARMESLSTSLKKVVMENNYLPPETARVYSRLFQDMIFDYNNAPAANRVDDPTEAQLLGVNEEHVVNRAAFISGMHWNYNTPATNPSSSLASLTATRNRWNGSNWDTVTKNLVQRQMDTPAEYGDIMIVQLKVGVFQPLWGWASASGDVNVGRYEYNGQDATRWVRRASSTELVYTYYVPCLNFRTITNS